MNAKYVGIGIAQAEMNLNSVGWKIFVEVTNLPVYRVPGNGLIVSYKDLNAAADAYKMRIAPADTQT